MKFGKSLLRCADMSDPEWAIFWVNYKLLKKKIKGIVESSKGVKNKPPGGRQHGCSSNPADISKNVAEVEFFRVVRAELKKTRYATILCKVVSWFLLLVDFVVVSLVCLNLASFLFRSLSKYLIFFSFSSYIHHIIPVIFF